MLFNFKRVLVFFILTVFLISCSNKEKTTEITQLPSFLNVPTATWEKLSQKKFYFGHQSVGFNIVDGIKDLMKERPQIKLNIMETSDKADFGVGIFAHLELGKTVILNQKLMNLRLSWIMELVNKLMSLPSNFAMSI